MTPATQEQAGAEALRKSLHVIQALKARLSELESGPRTPIAMVGLDCRFPGRADSPAAFRRLLLARADATGDWPADRWNMADYFDPDPDAAGGIYVRRGAFLDAVDRFDAAFFGLSPREAALMDPQHRLVLETAWTALLRARLDPASLAGSRTGVFLGIGQMDYARRQLVAGAPERITAYDGTGNGFCFAAGRLSYILGLRGPSLALDTACSSSLVAVHEACRSLRARETDLALAGGVHLILSPEITLFLCRFHALSPDGRCKTFDAAADGFGRGEGCGMLVLKRLPDALAAGDPIVAVIRGSAVNHDGASGGLTVPNGPAQADVIRSALADAGLSPHDLDVLEAHGTGTALGDPIEMSALADVFAGDRPSSRPLRVGSVKTNIGHLEAAAGAAGLIKAALAIRFREIPASLHFHTPSPRIPWADLPFAVPVQTEPWPAESRRAGVSSFGFSGTNAHVILEQPPAGREADEELLSGEPVSFRRRPCRIAAAANTNHPLLGRRIRIAGRPGLFFEAELGRIPTRYLLGHSVFSTPILPAAGFLEMAWAAGSAVFGPALSLESFTIVAALRLPDSGTIRVQTQLAPGDAGAWTLRILSCPAADTDQEPDWTLHANAILKPGRPAPAPAPGPDLAPSAAEAEECYRQASGLGFDYSPLFRVVESFAWSNGQALGRLRVTDALLQGDPRYKIHPTLLDACFQMVGFSLLAAGIREPALPSSCFDIQVHGIPAGPLSVQVTGPVPHPSKPGAWTADVLLLGGNGVPCVSLRGLTLSRAVRLAADAPSDWLYVLDWREQSLDSPLALAPLPDQICARANPRLPDLERQHRADGYAALLPAMESAAAAYAARALAQLGLPLQAGGSVSRSRLAQDLHLAGRHARLLDRLLAMLEEEGLLQTSGSTLIARPSSLPPDPEPRIRDLLGRHPDANAELTLLGQCGSRLAEVLAGRQDPLELLFPGGRTDVLSALYEQSPFSRAIHGAALLAVQDMLAALPADARLDILEIGAGTGGTTAHLLPALAGRCRRYVFSDLSPAFLEPARARFAQHTFLETEILNVEAPSPALCGQFDLVIAANVLHATADLHATLENTRALLKPGGRLLLIEATRRLRWVDLTFGLTEGWWRFTDRALRPDHPLLAPEAWTRVLREAGFPLAGRIGTDIGGSVFSFQSVILAQAAPARARAPAGGTLIVADDAGAGAALASEITGRGGSCTAVPAGQAALDPTGFDPILRGLAGPPIRHVVHLASLDAPPADSLDSAALADASQRGCLSVLKLTQAMLRAWPAEPPRLWLVTRQAVAASAGDTIQGVAQSALWGMGRVMAQECPDLACVRVDLDAGPIAEAAARLCDELAAGSDEDQVALRPGSRLVARLARYRPGPDASPQPFTIRRDAAYLITGAFSGLGLLLVQWLARQGAGALVLVGRHAPGPEAARSLEELRAAGARVLAIQADVTDPKAMTRALAEGTAAGLPLRGIIHAAGTLDDGALTRLTPERFQAVLAPKVTGAWLLHTLTREATLDFFVLFAAGAGLLGAPGQSNHAAANAFLDSFAHWRRAQGLPALSLDWGGWSGTGAAARRGEQGTLSLKGLRWIAPDQGLQAFEQLVFSAAPAQVAVLPMDWPAFFAGFRATPMVRDFRAAAAPAAAGRSFRDELAGLPAAEQAQALLDYVCREVAAILNLPADAPVDPVQGFFDLGMDSLTSLELQKRLQSGLGVALPATLVFEHPNAAAVSGLIQDLLDLPRPGAGPAQAPDDDVADLLAAKLKDMQRR